MSVEAAAIDGCMNGMSVEALQAAYVQTGGAIPCYPSITASGTAASMPKTAMTLGHPITMARLPTFVVFLVIGIVVVLAIAVTVANYTNPVLEEIRGNRICLTETDFWGHHIRTVCR